MTYFKNITDATELKKEYKRLALELHPDMGGQTANFQAMQNQYETALKLILSGKMTSEELENELKIDEAMREALNKIINLNIIIEIVGSWLWLTGNTYSHKEAIKEAGFKFAGKKKAWYWNDGSFKKFTKKSYSLDQIKDKYKSQTVKSSYTKSIA